MGAVEVTAGWRDVVFYAGGLLLAVRCLWLVGVQHGQPPPPARYSAPVELMERRLAPAREVLSSREPVRYVQLEAGRRQSDVVGQRQIAAYVLAPVVLTRSEGARVILLDVESDKRLTAFLRANPSFRLERLAPGLAIAQRVP